MNCLPLCTASVCPTISGEIVQRRAHVLSTRFSPFWFIDVIRFSRRSSRNGPFFVLLGIVYCPFSLRFLRLRIIKRELAFLRLRVLRPSGSPHGLHAGRPPLDLPSPPPSGRSTGF